MLWARSVMDDWIGEDGGKPDMKTLTAYFVALYFVMATQVAAIVLPDINSCWSMPNAYYWSLLSFSLKQVLYNNGTYFIVDVLRSIPFPYASNTTVIFSDGADASSNTIF